MKLVTIPFGYEELPEAIRAAVIPICVAREDEEGKPIAWEWFEALARISDRMVRLARRYLCDPWCASELSEGALLEVWRLCGTDFGRQPEWRLYAQAGWRARDLQAGGSWRERRGMVAALDDLEDVVRKRILVDPADYVRRYQGQLDYQALSAHLEEQGLGDVREMLDLVRDGATWDEVGERLGRSADSARMRFHRKTARIAKMMKGEHPMTRPGVHRGSRIDIMSTTNGRDTTREVRPSPEGGPGRDPQQISQPEPGGVP